MKLNNKRTILVGLAFLSICAFWQMYDNIIPLILTNTFHLNETVSGAIMAADNVLALFLLPFFGALSDRTNTKIGRRMPFILGGTAAAVILMNLLPLFDNGYANGASTGKLAMFVVTLGLLLVAMGTYRSPAVALMPDVTPKPLRSRANAIINLMGAVGGVMALGFITVMVPKTENPDYTAVFAAAAIVMVVSVTILVLTIRENKMAVKDEPEEKERAENVPQRGLSAPEKRSLVLILASVFFWFMGYNAVTTAFSKYARAYWGLARCGDLRLFAGSGAEPAHRPAQDHSLRRDGADACLRRGGVL